MTLFGKENHGKIITKTVRCNHQSAIVNRLPVPRSRALFRIIFYISDVLAFYFYLWKGFRSFQYTFGLLIM